MDIELLNDELVELTELEDDLTYFLQSPITEIAFTQTSEDEPETFFYLKGVKFKKRSGDKVFIKAYAPFPAPINVHIEEV